MKQTGKFDRDPVAIANLTEVTDTDMLREGYGPYLDQVETGNE